MYGPPPDPREVIVPIGPGEAPLPWLACLIGGLALAAWARDRRPFLFVLGATVALTAPLTWYVPTHVLGSFPTIDKAGSLLFYQDGVHRRMFDLADPAMRLIGVHVGHLWITAAFDLVLTPFGAMNAQALLNLVLTTWATSRLLERLGTERATALALAFAFGLNLHQLRDLNWYTVEKTALYWLPLYLEALVAGRRWAPLLLAGATFTNVYVGILCALAGAWRFLVAPAERRLVLTSALAVLPFAAWQWGLMHGAKSLGSPEQFLHERAALDHVSLWPPAWNRLELWRACSPTVVILAALGTGRARGWMGLAALTLLLALGPTHNPVYLLLFEVVPGFWRIAKPETFFHVTWLCLIVAAAHARPGRWLGPLLVVEWLLLVRTHPVFPPVVEPVEIGLARGWEQILR